MSFAIGCNVYGFAGSGPGKKAYKRLHSIVSGVRGSSRPAASVNCGLTT
jgi:hypothetical protein